MRAPARLSDPPILITLPAVERPIVVIEGEVVPTEGRVYDITGKRLSCRCGKDGSPAAHGAVDGRRPFTCDEVLAIQARVESATRRRRHLPWGR